jgi:hypothetical protein
MDYGFILGNFITEFNGRNPVIMKHLKDLLKLWEVNMVNVLQKGKLNGYLDRHIDSEGIVTYWISSFIGIRTLMVEGNARALRYHYMQQLRASIRVMRPLANAV